jgi:hypothetical protein
VRAVFYNLLLIGVQTNFNGKNDITIKIIVPIVISFLPLRLWKVLFHLLNLASIISSKRVGLYLALTMEVQMGEIIAIFKTYDSTKADLVKALLDSANIECFLRSDNAGGVLTHMTLTTGIDVMIRKEDQQKAAALISNS